MEEMVCDGLQDFNRQNRMVRHAPLSNMETSDLLPLLSRKANQFPHATHCTLLPPIKSHRSGFQLPLPLQRSSLAIGWICVFLSFPDPPKSCFVGPELSFQNLVGIPSTLKH